LERKLGLDFSYRCDRLHLKGAPFLGQCGLRKLHYTKESGTFLLCLGDFTFVIQDDDSKAVHFPFSYKIRILKWFVFRSEMQKHRGNKHGTITSLRKWYHGYYKEL
jgi:hypothetical protein